MRRGCTVALALTLLAASSACGWSPAPPLQQAATSEQERARGRALLAAYGCAACHRIKGIDAPQRHAGPPLDRIAGNSYIAGILPNNRAALMRWIMQPRSISPGTAMPDLGVSAGDARAITAYLYSQ